MTIRFPLVGMKFRRPADTIVSLLPPETPLFLRREPTNEHDPNAIQVWVRNLRELIPDSIEDITDACVDKDGNKFDPPDYDGEIFLGYIKAKTVDDNLRGSDYLAGSIDGMVEAGGIESAEAIPVKLMYGTDGSPQVEIITQPDGTVPMTNEVAGGAPPNETTTEWSDDFEKDRQFLAGEDTPLSEDESEEEDEDEEDDPEVEVEDLDIEDEDFTNEDETR